MTKTIDYTKTFQDMFAGKFADVNAVNDLVRDAAEFGAKFNKIALDAAEKNVELSNAWMKDSLGKYGAFTKVQSEPAEYAKVAADVASAQAQAAPEHFAKFAEVAKSAQMATVELVMAAGKEFQADAVKAAKSAVKAA
ncbi:hypothetical protein [Salaquimonas pukyongi]|uniref:hypothetical protein n=1 Tax=Salaquimonas pukyongi TaxID=2712698 RepID=UPI00096B74E9|nr:hypothetical protein [Salaquimonas pukyongi]